MAQEKLPTPGQAGKISSSLLLSSCEASSSFFFLPLFSLPHYRTFSMSKYLMVLVFAKVLSKFSQFGKFYSYSLFFQKLLEMMMTKTRRAWWQSHPDLVDDYPDDPLLGLDGQQ